MEFPLQFSIGGYSLSAHLLFESIAYITGYRYFLFLRSKKADPITDNNRVWILIGAASGAFIFSRLTGSLEDPASLMKAPSPWLQFFSGKTIIGGLLGGLAGVEIIKKIIGEKKSSGDLFTYPLILAILIGRTGCFFNGIHEPTYGLETNLITGMDLGDGIKRHPLALYEMVFLLVLWYSLRFISGKQSLPNGRLFKIFMCGYLGFRLMAEFIKPNTFTFYGLSTIQYVCLAGLLYYRKTLAWLIRYPIKKLSYGQQG